MITYLLTLVALTQSRWEDRVTEAKRTDSDWSERGASALELAVIAAALLAAAIAVTALVTNAVTNHSSSIR